MFWMHPSKAVSHDLVCCLFFSTCAYALRLVFPPLCYVRRTLRRLGNGTKLTRVRSTLYSFSLFCFNDLHTFRKAVFFLEPYFFSIRVSSLDCLRLPLSAAWPWSARRGTVTGWVFQLLFQMQFFLPGDRFQLRLWQVQSRCSPFATVYHQLDFAGSTNGNS